MESKEDLRSKKVIQNMESILKKMQNFLGMLNMMVS